MEGTHSKRHRYVARCSAVVRLAGGHERDPHQLSQPAERAGYTWQACWLFECVWQLVFPVETPFGMVVCMVCLLAALASMLLGLSRLYA